MRTAILTGNIPLHILCEVPAPRAKADGTKKTEKALTQYQIDNPKIKYKPKPGTKAHKRMLRKQKMDEGNRRAQNLKNTSTVPDQINLNDHKGHI